MNFRTRYNHIRLVEGTDPNANSAGMGGSEGQTGSPAATTQQEPTITQAQLDAIISRKLAKEREKLEAAQKAAEDARKLAEENERKLKEAHNGFEGNGRGLAAEMVSPARAEKSRRARRQAPGQPGLVFTVAGGRPESARSRAQSKSCQSCHPVKKNSTKPFPFGVLFRDRSDVIISPRW